MSMSSKSNDWGRFYSVGGWTLQDGTIFCNQSGILNQLMIDKFTADIKRTKTSTCCLIVGLLQYWIDHWIVKQWRSTRVKTNEMPFLNLLAGFIFRERELAFTFAICYRRSVRLSTVVCNVRATYSGGSHFRQYFYGIRYLGQHFTEMVSGEPLRRGSWTQEG